MTAKKRPPPREVTQATVVGADEGEKEEEFGDGQETSGRPEQCSARCALFIANDSESKLLRRTLRHHQSVGGGRVPPVDV